MRQRSAAEKNSGHVMASLTYEVDRMNITEYVKILAQKQIYMQGKEREILQEIAAITTPEFAQQAAETLNSKKHPYNFDGYLSLLQILRSILREGIPSDVELDVVQTGWDVETIIGIWRAVEKGKQNDTRKIGRISKCKQFR